MAVVKTFFLIITNIFSDENKTIFDWCKEGNLEEVTRMIEKSQESINIKDENVSLIHFSQGVLHAKVALHGNIAYIVKSSAYGMLVMGFPLVLRIPMADAYEGGAFSMVWGCASINKAAYLQNLEGNLTSCCVVKCHAFGPFNFKFSADIVA